MPIDADEFDRWMRVLQADIAGINTRLDLLNGRTREAEKAIAVLEDRGHPAVWGGGIASILVGFAEGLKWIFGK